MKYLKISVFFIIFTILLSGCATVTMISTAYPSKAHDAHIDIYVTNKPTSEYSEIALIKCGNISDKSTFKQIKIKAREIGADAVIITGRTGSSSVGIPMGDITFVATENSGFTAVAIKYKK